MNDPTPFENPELLDITKFFEIFNENQTNQMPTHSSDAPMVETHKQ